MEIKSRRSKHKKYSVIRNFCGWLGVEHNNPKHKAVCQNPDCLSVITNRKDSFFDPNRNLLFCSENCHRAFENLDEQD